MKCLSIKQGVEKEKDKAAMNSVKKEVCAGRFYENCFVEEVHEVLVGREWKFGRPLLKSAS